MKTVVLTFTTPNRIEDLTIPQIKSYAKSIKSDFKILDLLTNQPDVFFSFNEYLQQYDRILFISPYILVRPDTPNLFEVVPKESLGIFNEGRYIYRDLHIKAALLFYNEKLSKDWAGKYYNSNVMVISKKHRELFKKPDMTVSEDFDSYFNLKIHNTETQVYNLDYKFNRMETLDSHIGISRLDSYLINYSDAPQSMIRDIVQRDIQQWKQDSPEYKYQRNILIKLSAGLGDQIESEPVIRYVRKIYPDANISLATHHPTIFKHLLEQDIKVYDYTTWEGINDALIIMENNPSEKSSVNRLTQVLFHPTDFASISMLRRIIPNSEKTIRLSVDIKDVESVMSLLKDKNKDKKSIVVHPGKWWPSKTFPKQWWQKVVDLLSEKLTVILIGKTLSENQGYLDIEVPKDGFDFRDFTTLGENVALISMVKATLSNDSSPIHIAGAFDNWIITIPTCKHQDHILPWRNGSQTYRTKALCKKLLQDDLEVRHTEFYFDTIDKLPKGKKIDEYLPEPEDVVKEIFDIY
jgi:ADP-heptose:LPS heptosyltransferase